LKLRSSPHFGCDALTYDIDEQFIIKALALSLQFTFNTYSYYYTELILQTVNRSSTKGHMQFTYFIDCFLFGSSTGRAKTRIDVYSHFVFIVFCVQLDKTD